MQLFQLVGEYINQKLKKILIKSKTHPPYGFHPFLYALYMLKSMVFNQIE